MHKGHQRLGLTRISAAIGLIVIIIVASVGVYVALNSFRGGPTPSTTASAGSTLAEDAALYEAAKKEGVVNLYSSQTIQLLDNLSVAFTTRYPGVKMQYQRVVGPLSKIQSEQASGNYWGDMVTESHPLLVPVAQAGFFEKYRPPNAQNLPADYMDKNGTWYASQSILILLAYNTRDLKPEDAPKSWMDLCDTKWIGKFGMPDPVSFDMHIQFLSTMKKTLGDKWPQWIGCIKSLKPVYFASYTPVAQGIATGRVTIGITLTSSLAPLILANEKVAVDTAVIPIVAYLGSSGILKHAPHFNAAKLYLNWLLSNEGQKVQAVSGGYITPAGYSPDYFSNLVKLPQILLDSYMTSAQIQALRNEIGLPW